MSQDRCNRVPHTGWLRTGELCSLRFLETSSPKSAYRLGRPRTDASSRLSFLPSSSVRSPGHSLPRGSMIPASASVSVRLLSLCLCVFTWHSPRCISSPFLVRTQSESEVAQSCPTLCDPTDCSPPGSSIHGVLQARVLEWGAIAFSQGQLLEV